MNEGPPKKKYKILLMIDWFDPAFKAGGPIRSCINFINCFQNDFELFVFTGCYDLGSTEILQGIEPGKWNIYNGKAQVFYALPKQLNRISIADLVNELEPDYIYLNSMFSLKFSLLPLWLKKSGRIQSSIILAPRGMLKKSALAFKPVKKKLFLLLSRITGLQNLVTFQATDTQEQLDINQFFPKATIVLASNLPGVVAEQPMFIEKKSGTLSIIFVGRIHPIKNLAYLLTIIAPLQGEISLTIIGAKEDPAYWEDCSQLVNKLPSTISASFLGEQTHDFILSQIEKHHLFVLPTQGENFGHAIFEALALGRPVMISDQTPWRNLKEKNAGWDIPLDQPQKFKEAFHQAIQWNQNEFDAWSTAALSVAKNLTEQTDLKSNYFKLFS